MGLKTAALTAAAMLIALPVAAQEIRHDRLLELAAARKAAEQLGELRGTIAHQQLSTAFYEEARDVRLGFPRALHRRPRLDPQALPPLVMNERAWIDPIITGSSR